MCGGGGGSKPYSAYSSGDFEKWKRQFDTATALELAAARGEIPQHQARAQVDAIRTGAAASPVRAPKTTRSSTYTPKSPMDRGFRDEPAPKATRSATYTPRPKDERGFPDVEFRYEGRHATFVPVAPDGDEPRYNDKTGTQSKTSVGGSLSALENKIKEDPSAAMEMRELMRQRNINLGKIGIDQAFSKFGDDYYRKYRDDYTAYYFPQLDEQYGKVTDKMTATLADRGILTSSIGSNKFADLAKEHSNARTNISNEALDAANKLRGQVESAKSNLYSLNEASADPQAINARAIGQATALVAPPTYSPLGNIFAGALDAFGNYMAARQNRPSQQGGYISPYPTGYGSGRVVR